MNNACLKNPILEMMAEMDKLRQENEQLTKEKDEWKEGFMILHNKMEEQKQNDNKEDIGMLNKYEKDYLCGCESEENLDAYSKALENCSIRRFN